MPTEYWYPITDPVHGAPYDAWTNSGGANKNASCKDGATRSAAPTPDDASSYITATTVVAQSLNIDWPRPISAVGAVFNANVRYLITGGTNITLYLTNVGGTHGTAWFSNTGTVGYATGGPVDVLNPATYRPGGGSWQASDFNDDISLFVTAYRASGGGDASASTVWGQLDYTPAVGGFAFLLGIAGLLPVLGTLVDRAQFMSYLSWRRRFHPRHTILTGPEVETAWREIRAYRHPRFFFPAVA